MESRYDPHGVEERWQQTWEEEGLYAADPASPALDEPLPAAAERVMTWAGDADARHPEGIVLGVTHEAPLAAALLLGAGPGLAAFHTTLALGRRALGPGRGRRPAGRHPRRHELTLSGP